MSKSTLAGILTLIALNAGCGGPAEQYVERGNKFLETKHYPDAEISYRKAIQKDPKLGEAYYGFGRVEIEEKNFPRAYLSLKQAAELLPRRVDIKVKLADLVLGVYQTDPGDAQLYSTLTNLTNEILSLDPESYDGLRMKGNLALFDRKPDEAIKWFQRANEIKPLQEYLVMGYAQALIQTGRGKEAERLARQLIERKKEFGPIYDLLFEYYRSSGNAAAAEDVLREKTRNNPSDSNAFIQLAAYYRQVQKPAAAQAVLDELLQVPRTDAYLAVGDFFNRSGELDAAAAAYQKGSQEEPGNEADFAKRLAAVRIAQKRYEEALEILDQILKKTPADREAATLEAGVLLTRAAPGDLDKAVAVYQTILRASAHNPVAELGLGKAYLAKNDFTSARKALLVAKNSDQNVDEAMLMLASISLHDGKPAEALVFLDELLRRLPGEPRGRYLKATAQMALGNYDDARPDLDRLAREYPQATDVNLLRGQLAIVSKRYQDAEAIYSKLAASGSDVRFIDGLVEAYVGRQQFEKALQMLEAEARKSPQQLTIRRILAKTAVRAGQFDRAINELHGMLEKVPNSVTLLTDLGEAYQAKGDLANAEKEFEKATEQGGGDPQAYFLLGYTLRASGRRPEAIRAYHRALAMRPNDPLTMNNLAYALADGGDSKELDEALQLAHKAVDISPGESELRDTLGWVLLKKGQSDQALRLFAELCRNTPANPSYRHHLGLALLAKGNMEEAEKMLQRALDSNPPKGEAAKIRDELARASR